MQETGIKGNIHTIDITGVCIFMQTYFPVKQILPRIEMYIVYIYAGLVSERILHEENLNITDPALNLITMLCKSV